MCPPVESNSGSTSMVPVTAVPKIFNYPVPGGILGALATSLMSPLISFAGAPTRTTNVASAAPGPTPPECKVTSRSAPVLPVPLVHALSPESPTLIDALTMGDTRSDSRPVATPLVSGSVTAPDTGVLMGGMDTSVTTSKCCMMSETGCVSSPADTGTAITVVPPHGLCAGSHRASGSPVKMSAADKVTESTYSCKARMATRLEFSKAEEPTAKYSNCMVITSCGHGVPLGKRAMATTSASSCCEVA